MKGAAMKLDELWIADGEAFTCSVSTHRIMGKIICAAKAEGSISESGAFVSNVILAAFDRGKCDYHIADFSQLRFVDKDAIDERAIELLMRIVGLAFVGKSIAIVVVDNIPLKETLMDLFRRDKRGRNMLIFSGKEWRSSQLLATFIDEGLAA